MGDIPFERHHRASGGVDTRPLAPFDVRTPGEKDISGQVRVPMPDHLAVRVLAPLCRHDIARFLPDWAEPSEHGGDERAVTSLVWSSLHAAGFKQFVCFVRGYKGQEEILVVLPEGSVSWPIRQLVPSAADVIEVHGL